MGVHDQSDLFRDGSRDIAMVTDFWCESATIGIPHLHSVRWHSTTDGRIATRMRALTLPMTLLHPIKIGQLWSGNPWVLQARRLRRAGSRWALPRISSSSCCYFGRLRIVVVVLASLYCVLRCFFRNSFILGSKSQRSRSRGTKSVLAWVLHFRECWLLLVLWFVIMYRVVFSTYEVLIAKNSKLLSLSCQHLNVTCDEHVMLTVEVCVQFFIGGGT